MLMSSLVLGQSDGLQSSLPFVWGRSVMTYKQTELALTSLVRARCARPNQDTAREGDIVAPTHKTFPLHWREITIVWMRSVSFPC